MAEKSKPREGNLSRTIAEYVLNPPALGGETKDRAKKALVDTVSANLAGTTCEVFPVFKAYLAEAGAGDRVILGSSIRCAPEYAAMINGTMISSLEFDDVLSLMPGHPSAAVMAVLCADESALRATGKEVLDAYAIGIQAGARVAQACTMDHYFRGFHGTGTMTMFSAIAALCRINKFSLEQIQRALGIAASFAAGVQGNFGTMTKPLHSGWAARNAYEAVRLAKAGLTSSEYVFEVEGGFFDCYGSENSSVKHVEDILAAPWVFDEPGITMKLFPCCYADFRGMDGLMKLRDRMGVTPSDVEKVVCYVPPGSLTPLPFPRPTTPFESLFSLPYALAVTLLDGFPGLESFTQQRVDASDVAEMLDRIEVTENEICVEKYRKRPGNAVLN